MSKEKLYKTLFKVGIAYLGISLVAWLYEDEARAMLKERGLLPHETPIEDELI